VQAGWAVRSGTGDRRRYFEVLGVPEALCEVFSPRSREVADARARVERELGLRLHGGALAVLAKETRQAKDHDLDPSRLREVWDALAQEHDFGPGAGSRLRRHGGHARALEDRFADVRDVVLEQPREQGPTVTLARARALVFEAAAGRLSAEEASRLLARMECPRGGDLLLLAGGRVTSREIRELEQRVMAVAARAAGREGTGEALVAADREAGVEAAERALGEGRQLDREQRSAVAVLCTDAGWVCLTGRAGTGKGPTLHAAAEAYRNGGWQVLAVAMDGTTARRTAEQLGGSVPALTVEQLKVRAAAGALAPDALTVIFVDEASKLDSGHWGEIANVLEQHRVRVRAVGHDGQHEAIKLPGLFSEMLRDPHIPATELRQIRRHRDPDDPSRAHPWLRDYQVAVDQGHGTDAVSLLQRHDALKLYDTRAQAMGGMVQEWDSWRDRSEPRQSMLIVHGPNSDVDLVNELAQQRRLEAGELGTQAVPAVDRSYLLRPGDVVAIRNAAYTFPPRPARCRAARSRRGGPRATRHRNPLPRRSATRRDRPPRTVHRQPSRPARRTGSSSSPVRDQTSGSLASGGSARPGDSRQCRAAAHTRRPAASSPPTPPPRRLRAHPDPPCCDSRRPSPAARRSGGKPSRGRLLGLGYVSRAKAARDTLPRPNPRATARRRRGWPMPGVPEHHRLPGLSSFLLSDCGPLLAIGGAASTARSRACASSPYVQLDFRCE
jgi:AAA domain/TrwC relaxase